LVSEWLVPIANRLPAILAFALLLFQLAVPWTVPYLVTQDGPSHVYAASILRGLLLHHRTSIYSPLYTIQRAPLPNWTSTVLLAVIGPLAGAAHTEQLFMTVAFVAGFVCWCLAVRVLGGGSGWTPVANFLYQTWFLWIGFFNFYLGIALLPLAIAIYARHECKLTMRRAALVASILAAIFITHLMAAAAAMLAVVTIGAWVHLPRRQWAQFGLVLLAAAPTVALGIWYVLGEDAALHFDPKIAWAWHEFPMHIFLTASGEDKQPLLWTAMLIYAGLAALLLKRHEWRSAKGGLVIAAAFLFLAYLIVPDRGLSGNEAKIRFSWTVFVVAGLVACSAERLRYVRVPVAILFAWFGFTNALATQHTAASVSNLARDYLTVTERMEPGSAFVRLRYPAPQVAGLYGYEGSGRDMAFHLDALAAARRHCVDLTDYEALNLVFPVIFKGSIEAGWQSSLWSFEGPDASAVEMLRWLDGNLPVRIRYVITVGDADPNMKRHLESTMRLVALSPGGVFRMYGANPPAAVP